MTNYDESAELLAQEAGEALMARLRQAFPQFEVTWNEEVDSWDDGPYIQISAFARYIDKALFDKNQAEEAKKTLSFLEQVFIDGDEPTRNLIGVGFIEDFQTYTAARANGHSQVIPLLPPVLLKVWAVIERQWAGHRNLAEVIEAEVRSGVSQRTWAEVLGLPK